MVALAAGSEKDDQEMQDEGDGNQPVQNPINMSQVTQSAAATVAANLDEIPGIASHGRAAPNSTLCHDNA